MCICEKCRYYAHWTSIFIRAMMAMQIFLLDQHHQHSFYEIQKKLKFVIKYPHTVICLIIHLAVCVFLFEKFVTDDPSNYNRCEELLVVLHLLAQYFCKKKLLLSFTCLCDWAEDSYCHTTSEIFDYIAGWFCWKESRI